MIDRNGVPAGRPTGARLLLWAVVLLVATAAMVADLVAIFLAMRAVLDIGGSCADGGPYVSRTPCPEGSGAALALGIPGLFLFGGLMIWASARLRVPQLVALAWPALFLLLGWNFVEYAFKSPDGLEISLLICGIMFAVLAVGPLLFGLIGRRRRAALSVLRGRAQPARNPAPPLVHDGRAYSDGYTHPPARVVADLQRLATLRSSGALTDAEFEAAKRAALRQDGVG